MNFYQVSNIKEGEICVIADQEFALNKYKNPSVCNLPTAKELRENLRQGEGSVAKLRIEKLFDKDTFVEVGAYTTRGYSDFIATDRTSELEGVICGYGAIDGMLAFAFVEDATRLGGAIDERHAKKICDLYNLALNNGAPVIGIFSSNGTDIFEGVAGLAAYGRIMSCVTRASGVIPQIAYVSGNCIGTCAAIASMFDIVVKRDEASLYVTSPALTGEENAQDAIVSFCGSEEQCLGYIVGLLSHLPQNASVGVQTIDLHTDNLNRRLGNLDFGGDARAIISVIADNSVFFELGHGFAPSILTALTTIGGVRCGVVASSFNHNEGRIDAASARKAAKFVSFCDSFSIPVVTIVDSLGLSIDKENEHIFAPELAKLGMAYASSTCPKITVICGHAIGAAFVLLGSKSLGADLVYATESSEIGALNAASGVAFAWDKYITEEKTREDLVNEWKATVSSPANAASSGEIDDIITISEMRARICSALLMLSAKGDLSSVAKRKVLPL